MKRVIFDCDNTLGIESCDIDDGLAIFYLSSNQDCRLEAITTTYGNSNVDLVMKNTYKMVKKYELGNIKLVMGGKAPDDLYSEASEFLASYCKNNKGEISVLATGSLTNIYGAYLYDDSFFKNIKELVIMGGITDELIFPLKTMDELNLSCDFNSTYKILNKCPSDKISIITANNCMKLIFNRSEFTTYNMSETAIELYDIVAKWTKYIEKEFGTKGFYNWDVIAAIYLMRRELFDDKIHRIALSKKNLMRGYLDLLECDIAEEETSLINLPEISDKMKIKAEFFGVWEKI